MGVIPIPPFMGYILSQIGYYPIEESCHLISQQTHIGEKAVRNFVNQLINNEECRRFNYSDKLSIVLPSNLLIDSDVKESRTFITQQNFSPIDDFQVKRPLMPFNVNLMATTLCTTNCVYCYANRNIAPDMSLDRMISLIDELYKGGVVNISITGGDIFARKDWPMILRKMNEYGYQPFLSTKTPLQSEELCELKQLGFRKIQFSLDSINPAVLQRLIHVDACYLDKVKEMWNHCVQFGIDVSVRSVLTQYNGDLDSLQDLYTFLDGYECVKEWSITPAFFSEYKKQLYKDYEVDNENLRKVYEFTHSIDSRLNISLNKITEEGYVLKQEPTVDEFVERNKICLANTTTLSILANGTCSVCEMLYEQPEYVLGNINTHSVYEIWNSAKALKLYSPEQDSMADDSSCKGCKAFAQCRLPFGKRICFLDIQKSGKTYDYPDPRCPLAKVTKQIIY
jgi:radical SAM protein with 4Fe4S-binding SPASM domain